MLAHLALAHEWGFLGSADLEAHVEHALGFAAVAGRGADFYDVGSGAGLPGLVLACAWPEVRATLVDAHARRSAALRAAVDDLGLGSRVEVVTARVEAYAREPGAAARPLAVARGFGPAAVTAECATRLVSVGGLLVVSEPPDERPDRWPESGLAELGFGRAERLGAYVRISKLRPTPDRYPRRAPHKRPLW